MSDEEIVTLLREALKAVRPKSISDRYSREADAVRATGFIQKAIDELQKRGDC